MLDALKWKIQEVDIVLCNGFRFCPPRTTPENTGNIPITEGFLFNMLPINSMIRIGKVTGNQIKDRLEKELNNLLAKDTSERLGGWLIKFKGMKIFFNAFGEKEKRVQQIYVADAPLFLIRNIPFVPVKEKVIAMIWFDVSKA